MLRLAIWPAGFLLAGEDVDARLPIYFNRNPAALWCGSEPSVRVATPNGSKPLGEVATLTDDTQPVTACNN